MTPYRNLVGRSGVKAFMIQPNAIIIEFVSSPGKGYEYTTDGVGAQHIAQMKDLASVGQGLHTYVMSNVYDRFTRIVSL